MLILDESLEAYINPSTKLVTLISLVPSVVNSLLSPSSAIIVIKLYSFCEMCLLAFTDRYFHSCILLDLTEK